MFVSVCVSLWLKLVLSFGPFLTPDPRSPTPAFSRHLARYYLLFFVIYFMLVS